MPVLFAVIARGTTVLAKYASCAGNFIEVVEQVLAKIPPENNKLTYSHGSYLFHYVSTYRIIYMCITDDDFERSKAFSFLATVRRRFESQYGDRTQTALPYAMNSEFSRVLSVQMRQYAGGTEPSDKVTEVQDQVDELKGIMVRNIDNLATRGERLELLVDKTEDLESSAVSFKTTSRNLQRSMWWKNAKLTIILICIAIVVLYVIVTASCGGLAWPKCVHKKGH